MRKFIDAVEKFFDSSTIDILFAIAIGMSLAFTIAYSL